MAIFLKPTGQRWEPVEEGLKRMLAVGENSSAVLYTIRAGYTSAPESHPEEQGNYFVRGTEEWYIGPEGSEQAFLCKPGSLLIIPPNERHWSRVIGEEEVLLLTYFSPPRPSHRQTLPLQPNS